MGELEWLPYVRTEVTLVDGVPWKGPEDSFFIKAIKNVLLALLKGSMVVVFYGSGFMIGKTSM